MNHLIFGYLLKMGKECERRIPHPVYTCKRVEQIKVMSSQAFWVLSWSSNSVFVLFLFYPFIYSYASFSNLAFHGWNICYWTLLMQICQTFYDFKILLIRTDYALLVVTRIDILQSGQPWGCCILFRRWLIVYTLFVFLFTKA